MTLSKRLDPKDRHRALIEHALVLATHAGVHRLTREQIAEAAGISPALVSHYLGTMGDMRRTIMRAAVKQRIVSVVARGIAVGDPFALRADDDLKRRAAAFLAELATPA